MVIEWYPGHMTKAKRAMQEDIKLVDVVIELLDARAPLASKNPDIDSLAANKARVVVINKSDMSDPKVNNEWLSYFKDNGGYALLADSRTRAGNEQVRSAVLGACSRKIERDRARGIKQRPIKAMICGIPNVGKSTFINSYAGKSSAKTGNKPGVTRGDQWIRIGRDIELLDTPGLLWPRFDDQLTGIKLAVLGSIRDEVLDAQELAVWLLDFLKVCYPQCLAQRYGFTDTLMTASGHELLNEAAIARNCLLKGAQPDLKRAAQLVLADFRSARLGRISLERPPRAEENGRE